MRSSSRLSDTSLGTAGTASCRGVELPSPGHLPLPHPQNWNQDQSLVGWALPRREQLGGDVGYTF